MDKLKLNGIGLHSSYAGKLFGAEQFVKVFDESIGAMRPYSYIQSPKRTRKSTIRGWVHQFLNSCTTRRARSKPDRERYAGTLSKRQIHLPARRRGIFSLAGRIKSGVMRRLTAEQRQAWMPSGLAGALQTIYLRCKRRELDHNGGGATIAPLSQLLFGTDHPFVSASITIDQVKQLGFSADRNARDRKRERVRDLQSLVRGHT